MKTKNLIALAAAAILLSACIPSVNPFYTEKDVVFDPRLLGTWGQPGNTNESWTFAAAGDQSYQLSILEEGKKQGEFKARLFKLKGQLFLDTVPGRLELREDQATMVGMSLIPGHLLLRVRQIEPNLQLEWFDWDWLKKYLEEHPQALKHHVVESGDTVVLTADTRELQRFVLKHAKDGKLFKVETSGEALVRLTDPPPAASAPPQ